MNEFFDTLSNLLNQYDLSLQEKQDILNDYRQMAEDAKQKGLADEAIKEMLGSPEKIVKELDIREKEKFPGGEKIIALSPFAAFIIFMILGLTKNLWHPGWMVFLIIPVTAIIIEMGKNKEEYLLTALSPFAAFTFFMLFGFLRGIWNPTWLIFLIIPVLGIIESKKEMDRLTVWTALSPFFGFAAFFLVGFYTGAYQLSWLFLLFVIFFGILQSDKKTDKILLMLSLILSTAGYIALGYYYGNWVIASSAFILFVIMAFFTDVIKIGRIDNKTDRAIVIVPVILFLIVGYAWNSWAAAWLILLLIPMIMIVRYRTNYKLLTPLSPFVSTAIFFLLGYFYHLWNLSWIAFILIPVVAIIENMDSK